MTQAVARPASAPSPATESPASARPAGAAPDPDVESTSTTPPATAPLTMHDLWIQAGGGTDEYDVDRYVGLLRDHGLAGPRAGLVQIVRQLLVDFAGGPAEELEDDAVNAFSKALVDALGKHGYRIHDIALCVRPKDHRHPLTYGRPMTPEEEASLVIPSEAQPRRRRS